MYKRHEVDGKLQEAIDKGISKSLYGGKIQDVGQPASGGRTEKFWRHARSIIPYFLLFRKGPEKIPTSFSFWSPEGGMKHFNLKGWEFGNWLSQEDRLNYVCATNIALYDLAKVLGVSAKRIGLGGYLTMSIGARGKSKARAHFEPSNWVINLTRYYPHKKFKDSPFGDYTSLSKEKLFAVTGGVGSLGHEYIHFLDYWFGGFVDKSPIDFSLSGGRSIDSVIDLSLLKKNTLRGQTAKILKAIIYKDERMTTFTPYYRNLYQRVHTDDRRIKIPSYWIRKNELLARAGEQAISIILKEKGIRNDFLVKNKYEDAVYMPPALAKKVTPLFKRLFGIMKRQF
ncbi:MAG: LPD1 domain-containing protein [Bacteroidota bacterium]